MGLRRHRTAVMTQAPPHRVPELGRSTASVRLPGHGACGPLARDPRRAPDNHAGVVFMAPKDDLMFRATKQGPGAADRLHLLVVRGEATAEARRSRRRSR